MIQIIEHKPKWAKATKLVFLHVNNKLIIGTRGENIDLQQMKELTCDELKAVNQYLISRPF